MKENEGEDILGQSLIEVEATAASFEMTSLSTDMLGQSLQSIDNMVSNKLYSLKRVKSY